MTLFVRALSETEQPQLERLIGAQAAPVRLVRRARIVWWSAQGETPRQIAERLALGVATVRDWIKRFTAQGLAGLDDAPRSGRPRTYPEDARSRVIAKARGAPPKPAGDEVPPTCHWTLDDLTRALNEAGVPIKRSQIRRVLKAQHITWQKPRSWLTSDDPAFAENRGPASSCLPPPRLAVPSWA